MKKKIYYYVKLYQASKLEGYINENTMIREISTNFDDIPEVESYAIEEVNTIIVEKVSPFRVREITTGVIFPIINILTKILSSYSLYYIEKPLRDIHTFIFSKGDTILGKEVQSVSEIDKYNSMHPNVVEFKKELLNAINYGQVNMENKKREDLNIKTKRKVLQP